MAGPVIVEETLAEVSDELIATNAPLDEAETLPAEIVDEALEADSPPEGLRFWSPAKVVGLLGSEDPLMEIEVMSSNITEEVLSGVDPVKVDESAAEVANEIPGTNEPLEVADTVLPEMLDRSLVAYDPLKVEVLSPAIVDVDEIVLPDRLPIVEAVSLPVIEALPNLIYGLVAALDGLATRVDESIDVAEESPMSIDEKLLRIEDMLLAKLPPLMAEELADPPEDPTFKDV